MELHNSFCFDKGNVAGATGFFYSDCCLADIEPGFESGGLVLVADSIIGEQRFLVGGLLSLDWNTWLQTQRLFHTSLTQAGLNDKIRTTNSMYMRWIVSSKPGVGSQLRSALYAHALAREIKTVFCTIMESPLLNERSMKVHEADGWKKMGVIRNGKLKWGFFERKLGN